MRRVWFALLFLVPLPAVIFLAQDGYFSSSDGMIHLYRLFELDRALHAGMFYPRWFPLSGYGYGLPVLNYYPPLSYYLAELFHLVGAGYIGSIKLVIALGFVAAAFSMFLFARDLLGNVPAFVAAVAYTYLPYLLSDAYVRGNFPEFLAMSILPLALWAFRRLVDSGATQIAAMKVQSRPSSTASLELVGVGRLGGVVGAVFNRRIFLAALAFAAIILLHHLTAMLFAALLLAYIFLLFILQRDWTRLIASIGSILLALALSAFFWLPSLAELNLVYVGPASVARFLVNRLVGLADFLVPSLAYVYLPQSEVLKHAFGFPQTLLALLVGASAIVLVLRGRRMETYSRFTFHVFFFFIVTVVSIFMTLSFSAPLWYAIPTLRFMQFPWRFEILAGIGIAFLLGVGAKWIADATTRFNVSNVAYASACVLLIALGVANLPVRAFPLIDSDVNLLHSDNADYVIAQMGWGWTREFVPAAAQEVDSIYTPVAKPSPPVPDPAKTLPTIQIQNAEAVSDVLRVSTKQAFDLSLHTFYFPGWQAYIDKAPARTFPRGSLGLASVTVPPGDHVVSFQFQDTPIRVASNTISLLTGIACWVGLFVVRRRAAIAGLGMLVLIGALWAWHSRIADDVFFDESLAPPVPLSANLDNRAMLIGCTTDRASYHAGETIYVTLYWLALNEMDKDYQVSVHLVGLGDATQAQQDGPPDQGLTPTTRWLPGEIVVDHHSLVLGSVAPGAYRLSAGMYLPMENGYANLGDQIELGHVQVSQ